MRLRNVSYLWLIAYVALIPLVYLIRAVRWRVLLRATGARVPLRHTFWTTMVGFTVNTLLPTRIGGEVVRAYVIDEKERVGFSRALSSIAVERVLDVALIVGLAIAGLLALPATVSLPAPFLQAILGVTTGLGAILLVLIIGVSGQQGSPAWIGTMVAKIPGLRGRWKLKIANFVQAFVDGSLAVGRNRPILAKALFLTISLWLTIFISTFVLFQAFDLPLPVAAVLLGSMLVQLSFMLPGPVGYIGTYQIYWTTIFGALTGAEVGALAAIAIAAQIIGHSFIFSLGFGGMISLKLSFSKLFRFVPRVGGHA